MYAKTDSEVTSLAPSSPPRSPRRPIYYVRSPSQPDAEKLSLAGSTPGGSPIHHPHHHRYASSTIHQSRESTTGFSASLKQAACSSSWRKIPSDTRLAGLPDDEEEDERDERLFGVRCYVILFVFGFAILFSLFSLILWGASRSYKPQISVKSVVFEFYNVQAGMDLTGVPTKMLSLNSTVEIRFRNPATFFGVHVTSTPLELSYSDLRIASGQMEEFYEPRQNGRVVSVSVAGSQVPLYGGGSSLNSGSNGGALAPVPLDLTFVVRARANVLGKLVKSKFYRHVHCSLQLRQKSLGKPLLNLKKACEYRDQ